jgi:pre-mRNA-splicing factor 18
MDFLKSEIASKRKALDQDVSRPTKYMRKGDLEKLKQEQERKERDELESKNQQAAQSKAIQVSS